MYEPGGEEGKAGSPLRRNARDPASVFLYTTGQEMCSCAFGNSSSSRALQASATIAAAQADPAPGPATVALRAPFLHYRLSPDRMRTQRARAGGAGSGACPGELAGAFNTDRFHREPLYATGPTG